MQSNDNPDSSACKNPFKRSPCRAPGRDPQSGPIYALPQRRLPRIGGVSGISRRMYVMKQVGGTVLLAHFTEETCRRYQYDLGVRELTSGTIRVRLAVPSWDTVKVLLQQCGLKGRAILALMAYGGLRRSEVAALDMGDVAPDFGLRRVMGKGGHEVPVALPAPARGPSCATTWPPSGLGSEPLRRSSWSRASTAWASAPSAGSRARGSGKSPKPSGRGRE